MGVISLAELDEGLASRLAGARERAGYSEEEVALLLGQPRPVISNWEHGIRRPNTIQLAALAAAYRTTVAELRGDGPARPKVDFERLMFRDAGPRLDARAKFEIARFLSFLDSYGDLLESLEERPGMTEAPLLLGRGFASKEDVKRKADEARAFFGLGSGPVGDLRVLADLHGIAVYRAPLGQDLRETVSGAFLRHATVGAAILINGETTPGRQQFTLAHELAHALFHTESWYVGFFGRRERDERFADEFASEFLVPVQSLRGVVETIGLPKVEDPAVVVYLQRLFRVSWAMMLVRLQAANLVSSGGLEQLRQVHPVQFAEQLGFSIGPEEWSQEPDRWGLNRFPPRYLGLLRRALTSGLISIRGAAAMTDMAEEDLEELISGPPPSTLDEEEFSYLAQSG